MLVEWQAYNSPPPWFSAVTFYIYVRNSQHNPKGSTTPDFVQEAMQTSNLEEKRGKIKHYWHCRCRWRKSLWSICRKKTTYCARKHKQLPPQFAGLETSSQVFVFFQCRHKKRILASENGAGSERNGSIHLLSWSFTVQSYLSGKPSQRMPRWGVGVELLCTGNKILVIYMLSNYWWVEIWPIQIV